MWGALFFYLSRWVKVSGYESSSPVLTLDVSARYGVEYLTGFSLSKGR